jgi:rubrerythrin
MKENEIKCMHACKNTCAMLNEALRKEASIVRFYEGMLDECNLPEVRSFITETVEDKRKAILRIIQKLNEIHARSQVIDGMISSFNNIDG